MEKSFEIRFPRESEYEKLKVLWQTAFDDTKESLDSFFKKTVAPERVLAAFKEGEPVSALYMLEGEILTAEKSYSAYYIYAVSTHPDYRGKGLMKRLFNELFNVARRRGVDYLFLVPEKDYLFDVYKGIGFENGFSYSEKILFKKDFTAIPLVKTTTLTYEKYRNAIAQNSEALTVAALKESTFNSFFNSVSGEVKTAFIENEGYALYEESRTCLTVFELFGNENLLLSAIFQNTEKEKIVYRQASDKNPVPYGMYYKINDVPEIENGFFGIPYAN